MLLSDDDDKKSEPQRHSATRGKIIVTPQVFFKPGVSRGFHREPMSELFTTLFKPLLISMH
jgi:hypothetical protein